MVFEPPEICVRGSLVDAEGFVEAVGLGCSSAAPESEPLTIALGDRPDGIRPPLPASLVGLPLLIGALDARALDARGVPMR